MKQIIRLTEGDLRRIITNSVNEALNELDWKTYANAAQKAGESYQTNQRNGNYDKSTKRFHQIRKFNDAASDGLSKKYGHKYRIGTNQWTPDEFYVYDDGRGWIDGGDGPQPRGMYYASSKRERDLNDDYPNGSHPDWWEDVYGDDKEEMTRLQRDLDVRRDVDRFTHGKYKYHKGKGRQ